MKALARDTTRLSTWTSSLFRSDVTYKVTAAFSPSGTGGVVSAITQTVSVLHAAFNLHLADPIIGSVENKPHRSGSN